MINILFILAINHYTGVTTWAYELIKGLSKFNVDVVFVSSNSYFISNKEYIKDISLHSNVIESIDYSTKYDVVFLHNTEHENISKKVGKKTVFISHGSMINSANPKLKHDMHVAVSGRSKYVLGADMFILNGIDLNKFKSNKLLNKIPKKCLYHNRFKPQKFVHEACEELNIELDYWKVIEKDVTKKIEESDFVMGYGRSVYEAMSMGKPVLVFGHNSPTNKNKLNKTGISSNVEGGFSDGWIDESNFKTLLYRNCCGWARKIYIDNKNDMIDLMKGYDYKMGNVNRRLAEEHLSSQTMVNSFTNIIKELYYA
jgi:glycosyltransferase involved in cell wall biosynthesis